MLGTNTLSTVKRKYFSPRVERTKKALEKATEHAAKKMTTIIDKQAEKGEDSMAKWLLEHAETPDGQRLIAPSVDRKQVESGPTGPQVLIGVGLGALPAPQDVGAKVEVIEVGRKSLDSGEK